MEKAIMTQRMEFVASELDKLAADARANFGGLTADQLNWRPADDAWSVAQCLDHLIKSHEAFQLEFEKLAAGKRANSFWENWSPFTGFVGRFLIKSLKDNSKKYKAPARSIVPPSTIDGNIVRSFEENIGSLKKCLGDCAEADREKTVLTSPFLSVMTYKLDDAYTMLIEHGKRHIRQAGRVVEAEGFPRS